MQIIIRVMRSSSNNITISNTNLYPLSYLLLFTYNYNILFTYTAWLSLNYAIICTMNEVCRIIVVAIQFNDMLVVVCLLVSNIMLLFPSFQSEGVDNVYPDHANDLHEAGLFLPNLPKIYGQFNIKNGYWEWKITWSQQNEKRNFYFCVTCSRYFSTSIHMVITKLINHLIFLGWE